MPFQSITKYFTWPPFFPNFFGMAPPRKPFFFACPPPPQIPPAPPSLVKNERSLRRPKHIITYTHLQGLKSEHFYCFKVHRLLCICCRFFFLLINKYTKHKLTIIRCQSQRLIWRRSIKLSYNENKN